MKIPLTQGLFAKIDKVFRDKVLKYNWHALYAPGTDSFYAVTNLYVNGKREYLYLSRYLAGLKFGDKRRCDHKNHDTLDNRMENLRICLHSQNMQNRRKSRKNKSGFKGVFYYKRDKKWRSEICFNNKKYHIGSFNSKKEAAIAYNNAAKKFFGEFSFLNVVINRN